jgi:multiple sugar transport system substrate-binding protein
MPSVQRHNNNVEKHEDKMMTNIRHDSARLAASVGLAAIAALLLASCGGSSTTKPPSASGPVRGQTIIVAIAYPAPPKALLQKFTQETGVKVNWTDIQFDDLQTKIASAAEANTYFADVADVDWSKVGGYSVTKWFLPLNSYFNIASARNQYPQLSSFIRNGTLIGMPFDSSLLVTTVNKKDFAAAGISVMPTTIAQYTADLRTIASKGVVKAPLDIPFAAAEGLSTYWYEATAAFGGQVLSSSDRPEFTAPSSAGYKALEWMVNAYKTGLVPTANLTSQDYQAFEADQAHNLTASVFSDYGGDLGTIYQVPSQSTVVGDIEYIPTPGVNGAAPNLGNPDGFGIPAQAKHVAAAVAFMKWMEQPANQAAFAGAGGPADSISTFPLPSNRGGLTDLVKSGKLPGGATLASLLESHSRAVFPDGVPPWYSAFSNSVYTNIHSAVAGQESVAAAIGAIASQTNSLRG